jgi:hypothetical protein
VKGFAKSIRESIGIFKDGKYLTGGEVLILIPSLGAPKSKVIISIIK